MRKVRRLVLAALATAAVATGIAVTGAALAARRHVMPLLVSTRLRNQRGESGHGTCDVHLVTNRTPPFVRPGETRAVGRYAGPPLFCRLGTWISS